MKPKKPVKNRKNHFYASGLVYRLGIGPSIILMFLGTLTLRYGLGFFILISLMGPFFMVLTLHRFYFYEDYLKIKFILFPFSRGILVPYDRITNITYRYKGYGGSPVIIIKTHKKNFIRQFVKFCLYRFVLYDREKVVAFLIQLKEFGVRINVLSDKEDAKKVFKGVADNFQ